MFICLQLHQCCLNSGRFEDVAAPVGGVSGRGAADTFLLADCGSTATVRSRAGSANQKRVR